MGRHSLLAAQPYCTAVKLALASHRLQPQQLLFELGADLAAELPGEAAAFVAETRLMGCGIVLDRFTDQSPALLRTIGPDYVKIRYDLLQQEYGVEDALAMGDGLASIAARTGYGDHRGDRGRRPDRAIRTEQLLPARQRTLPGCAPSNSGARIPPRRPRWETAAGEVRA